MDYRFHKFVGTRELCLVFSVLFLLASTGFAMAAENLTTKSDPTYQPVPTALSALQAVEVDAEIILFHGAWCSDCQREVPRFMRILEVVNNPHITLTEYEVNPQKQDVFGKFEEYSVKFVPTIIVMREGREIGRIVEKPQKSLEEDLVAILAGKK